MACGNGSQRCDLSDKDMRMLRKDKIQEPRFMKKIIRFTPETIDKIQAYANENFNGNFSMAVRFLCMTAIKNNT